MIIGKRKWSNIIVIKANMLLFEVMSDLKVNFHKKLLAGVNILQNWLEEAVNILYCMIGSTSFKYLG